MNDETREITKKMKESMVWSRRLNVVKKEWFLVLFVVASVSSSCVFQPEVLEPQPLPDGDSSCRSGQSQAKAGRLSGEGERK